MKEDQGSNHSGQTKDDSILRELRELKERDFSLKWVVAIAAFVGLFFVGERLLAWHLRNQVIEQAREAMAQIAQQVPNPVKEAQDELEEFSEKQKRRAEEIQRENQARLAEIRRERESSTTGRWLAKNCSDWTRAWNQLEAETARKEMKRHCEIYKRYLQTGIAPPGTPRAENRTR